MSDGRLSEAALHNALNPLTVPGGGAGGWVADIFAVLGLALLTAALIAFIFEKLVGRRNRDGTDYPDLSATFEQLRSQPEDARRLALFRMLNAREPEEAAKLRPALFDPSAVFDAGQVEALIRNARAPHD